MSLTVLSRPDTWSAIAGTILYKLQWKGNTFNQINNSSGFIQIQINSSDVHTSYNIGDLIYIQTDDLSYDLYATVTASSFSTNTLITTDGAYVSSATTGFINNHTTRPNYRAQIDVYGYGVDAGSDYLLGTLQFTPSSKGLVTANIGTILKANLSPNLHYTFSASQFICQRERIDASDDWDEDELPSTLSYYIKYTQVWTGSSNSATSDSANLRYVAYAGRTWIGSKSLTTSMGSMAATTSRKMLTYRNGRSDEDDTIELLLPSPSDWSDYGNAFDSKDATSFSESHAGSYTVGAKLSTLPDVGKYLAFQYKVIDNGLSHLPGLVFTFRNALDQQVGSGITNSSITSGTLYLFSEIVPFGAVSLTLQAQMGSTSYDFNIFLYDISGNPTPIYFKPNILINFLKVWEGHCNILSFLQTGMIYSGNANYFEYLKIQYRYNEIGQPDDIWGAIYQPLSTIYGANGIAGDNKFVNASINFLRTSWPFNFLPRNNGSGAAFGPSTSDNIAVSAAFHTSPVITENLELLFEINEDFSLNYDVSTSGASSNTRTFTVKFFDSARNGVGTNTNLPATQTIDLTSGVTSATGTLSFTVAHPNEVFYIELTFGHNETADATGTINSMQINNLPGIAEGIRSLTFQIVHIVNSTGVLTESSLKYEAEYLEPCDNAVNLVWRNSGGGESNWVFDYNYSYTFNYANGRKAKRVVLTAPNLTLTQWEALEDLNALGAVYQNNIPELLSTTNKTKSVIGAQVYEVRPDGTQIGVIVIPKANQTFIKKRRHQFEVEIEYPEYLMP